MLKLVVSFAGGVLVGIGLMLLGDYWPGNPDGRGDPTRDIVEVATMPSEIAEQHRQQHYERLASIADVVALPSGFARAEAAYVLAGRSDPAKLQGLIFESNRIADDIERTAMLEILLTRLSEVDPRSALALARTGGFDSAKALEKTIWRSWARHDLDDALFAVRAQPSIAQQTTAAQNLYAAFGYMGNEITDRIEAELEIPPSQETKIAYLYKLANQSPEKAIEFINAVPGKAEQHAFVSRLAAYIAAGTPEDALRYTNLFTSHLHRQQFESLVRAELARENPRATIEEYLASGSSMAHQGGLHSAASKLANDDLDLALQYFDQARSEEARQVLSNAIIKSMINVDPARALQWARDHDRGNFPRLEMSVIGAMALENPEMALAEASRSTNVQMRSMLVSTVIQHVSDQDPEHAAELLDNIDDPRLRTEASRHLVGSWMQRDPDAALSWIRSQDEKVATEFVTASLNNLMRHDVDMAIRLLGELDIEAQRTLRPQIVNRLAATRTPAEALQYLQQFEGQPDYEQIKASFVVGLARNDPVIAKQYADQITEPDARDIAYTQMVQQRAQTHPAQAIAWLGNIRSDIHQANAARGIAAVWYDNEPDAATRWVRSLPRGMSRDSAISSLATRAITESAEIDELIASMESDDLRARTKLSRVYAVFRTDPERALRMLDDEDIPQEYKDQFRQHTANSALVGY